MLMPVDECGMGIVTPLSTTTLLFGHLRRVNHLLLMPLPANWIIYLVAKTIQI